MRDIGVAYDAFAAHAAGWVDLSDDEAVAAQNAVSAHSYALSKDSPGKTWWQCPLWHPAVGRALKIDRKDDGGVFALAPFRLWHDGERHLILAALPCPRHLGPVDLDWLGIADVLAWDPRSDSVFILGDEGDALVGRFADPEEGTMYRSPREFFTEWAVARAHFYARWRETKMKAWAHPAPERDLCPGKLAIGALEKLPLTGLPSTIHARGIDPRALNNAILRQANLPRAVNQQQRFAA